MSDLNEPAELSSKPEEAEAAGTSLVRTLVSLAIFVGVYYLLFKSWVAVLVIVTVILLHECGHFIAMKRFGYQSVNMTFVPLMGAYVSGRAINHSRRNKIIVLLAGPLPGIVIGVLMLFLWQQDGGSLYRIAALSFLGLNLFNLLPVYPLDGGQFFQVLFFEGSRWIQLIFLCVSLVAMLYFFYHLDYSWFFMVVAVLIGFRINSLQLIARVRRQLDEQGVDYHCSYDDLTDDEYRLIRTALINNSRVLGRKYDVNEQYGDEQPMIRQVEAVLLPAYDEDMTTGGKALAFAVWLIALVMPALLLLKAGIWS